jgi:DNA repair protein RadC
MKSLALHHVSEVKLTYTNEVPPKFRNKITEDTDIVPLFREAYERDGNSIGLAECFYCAYLSPSNEILAIDNISKGGITGTVADPKTILVRALLLNATQLIIAHNHPSGNRKASSADERVTRQIRDAANLLDMTLLDSIIITDHSHSNIPF